MRPSTVLTAVAVVLAGILIMWTAVIGYYDEDLPVLFILAAATVVTGIMAGRMKDRADFKR